MAKMSRAGMLASLALIIGCTQMNTPPVQDAGGRNEIPSSVSQTHGEMRIVYSEFGATLDRCVKDDTVYRLTGSEGSAGVLHYYSKEGELLGSNLWGDTPEERTRPPINISEYDCTRVGRSR